MTQTVASTKTQPISTQM